MPFRHQADKKLQHGTTRLFLTTRHVTTETKPISLEFPARTKRHNTFPLTYVIVTRSPLFTKPQTRSPEGFPEVF